MKRLKFEKLWLLSTQERRARTESFDPDVTSIVADNEFGKSSLVKSLYSALGADPYKTPEAWKNAKVALLLRFTVGGATYYILRQEGYFALFDDAKKLLWTASSVVAGLAPKIGELLDFHISLKQKGGKSITPPPAFCFLPFYVDQDNGWSDTWASFSGLGMVPAYKSEIAEFHTGIKPRQYYIAKSKRDEAITSRKLLSDEKGALLKAKKRFSDKRKKLGIALDVEVFKDRIQALLKEQNALQSLYDDLRAKVSDLQSLRSIAQEEVDIAERVLSELNSDIKFATDFSDDEIVCPVCSTVHDNDFANRFGLINDADACRIVLIEARAKVAKHDGDIEKVLRSVPSLEKRISSIKAILQETRGEVKLADMLKDESERLVDKSFEDEERVLDGEIGILNVTASDAKAEMDSLTKASRKKKIVEFYDAKLREFCGLLNITNIPSSVWGKVRPVISETGSLNPRLLLAYYYAVLHTIDEFSTSCFCPIVVDTPLQQDQDPENSKRLIRFAIENKPVGSQLILATGSLNRIVPPGRLIEPDSKRSLLSEDKYEDVYDFMLPFLNASLIG
ncbi:hypothetical protein L0666_06555 [Octadecabacter sp. CECT 8868]|uniref:hypothetical protein n=1 Tax=Octadecabacter algicola TaxID=2909342 RepID=UPI001F18B34A|nr:hypothetical protein [Octadecabacter algicola]MCF2904640.1 hypothetical protein [Octadecabacter algicola]